MFMLNADDDADADDVDGDQANDDDDDDVDGDQANDDDDDDDDVEGGGW